VRTDNAFSTAYRERFVRLDGIHAIRELARLRTQRERQWQRLHPPGGWLWQNEDHTTDLIPSVQAIFRYGQVRGCPDTRRMVVKAVSSDRRQIARRRVGRG
jgi:hypothetical protein